MPAEFSIKNQTYSYSRFNLAALHKKSAWKVHLLANFFYIRFKATVRIYFKNLYSFPLITIIVGKEKNFIILIFYRKLKKFRFLIRFCIILPGPYTIAILVAVTIKESLKNKMHRLYYRYFTTFYTILSCLSHRNNSFANEICNIFNIKTLLKRKT